MNDVAFVASQLTTVTWGQYMTHNCEAAAAAGWEAYPTQLCRYPSSHGSVPVILLNPDSGRLANWLVGACRDAGAKYPRHCAERLAVRIKCQSGNQFPVAGFVDEGPLYTFRDGITVTLAEIGQNHLNQMPTSAQEAAALREGNVSVVHRYARLVGTTREEYAAFVGKPATEFANLAWQAEIRAVYQNAWNSDRNMLLSAWAKSNLSLIDHKDVLAAKFDNYCNKVTEQWKAWPISGE